MVKIQLEFLNLMMISSPLFEMDTKIRNLTEIMDTTTLSAVHVLLSRC